MRRHLLVLIAILSCLLAGCPASSGEAAPPSGPASLYVTMSDPLRRLQPAPDAIIRDAAAVDDLYRAAPALPVVSEGVLQSGEAT